MRRLTLILALAALAAGVAATPGSTASFNDSTPCPASGPLLVCPTMYVGQPVNLQLIAFAGCDVYRWEIVNGALPAGLSMSSSGLVSGTPTEAVVTQPWVVVHDLTPSEGGPGWCGGDNHSERQFVFTVTGGGGGGSPAPGPAPGPAPAPAGRLTASVSPEQTWEAGWPLSVSINATGGTPKYTWKMAGTLPQGTRFSSVGGNGSTAHVRGVPSQAGTFPIKLTVTDAGGASAQLTVTLTVAPKLRIKTSSAGRARVGKSYRLALVRSGGVGSTVWVANGPLPLGLALDARTGLISGTPRIAGGYLFTIVLADSFGARVAKTYGLVVRRR